MSVPTPFRLSDRLLQLGYDAVATQDGIRTGILSMLCAHCVYGKIDGKTATWAQAFEACFGVPLETRERAQRKQRKGAA